jgi:hypothetical protein
MQNNKMATLLDILVVFILSTSVVSISSLVLNIFRVDASIILSAIFTLSVFWIRSSTWKIIGSSTWKINIKNNTHILPILMLLLIALLFRSEPYHYVAGGQDEGVYVNMSQYYDKYGKIFITDETRENLTDELKKSYDSMNIRIENRNNVRVEDQKEGSYLPGVYVKDQQNSEYVFQFYQLHPLWMSIFGKIFGDENRVYSLVFFSLLSLVAFYLLAFEFTKRKGLAFCAGALLAINPLHAFFSKFPVTEVVALSFSTLSFYYLLKYYNLAREKLYFPTYLVLSSLLMSGMFFTRISGFIYIPFFYLILITVHIYIEDNSLKRQLIKYVYSVFLLYAVSVWYGLIFSYPYSSDIYRKSFTKVFGGSWQDGLLLLLGISVLFYLALIYLCGTAHRDKLKYYLANLRGVIPYLFLIILALGLYKVYQLGFTEKYMGHPWSDLRWKVAGTEWKAFLYWGTFVVFQYLSPFILIVFGYVLFSQARTNNAAKTMLILFVLLFFFHISLMQWFIPYQYYYARYLLSEALPFILLFTVIGLGSMAHFKKMAYLLIGFSAVYMLFFTAGQFKGKEMHGLHTSLLELKKHLGTDDILILDQRLLHSAGELKTSLKFYYDYNVVSVNDKDKEEFFNYFCRKNKNIYLFNVNRENEHGELIKTIQVKADIFEYSNNIPMNIVQISKQYYLSKVSCIEYMNEKMKKYYTLFDQGIALGPIAGFYNDNVWTKEESIITNIDMDIEGNKFLVLETFGYNPLRNNMSKLNLKIKVNGTILEFAGKVNNKFYFSLPVINKIMDLTILSNTFIPKELGMNQDSRELGMDIRSIKLAEEVTH